MFRVDEDSADIFNSRTIAGHGFVSADDVATSLRPTLTSYGAATMYAILARKLECYERTAKRARKKANDFLYMVR
jgi:hypothetical protein